MGCRGMLRVSAWQTEDDSHNYAQRQSHGVEQIWHYSDGVQLCQSGSHKHLCAVRNETLCAARARVEQTCHLALVQFEAFADASCDVSCGNDSHGVVGCAKMGDLIAERV